ncbi:MAG: putative cathepsin B2 cysteine protease [Streblomastix strix]|uniref:Putative cathepsin B2 cysteine protease n=1 Tax=Streblomastix strix TaxID=222440 RepID=A0A5J4W7F4_9EUKA|nr:MAG: putative cathepsin B2 cysteine protease [Streblomastix strix]
MLIFILFTTAFASSIVDIVNSNPNSTWIATDYPDGIVFANGQFAQEPTQLDDELKAQEFGSLSKANDLPENYDVRKQYPGAILPTRDQGDKCQASWAIAVAQVFGAKMGMQGCSKGLLSVQQLISCHEDQLGCIKGATQDAWQYMTRSKGITTEHCFPFTSQHGKVPPCPTRCINGSEIERTILTETKVLMGTAEQYQQAIFDSGPFTMFMDIYEDFLHYKSGIYQHVTGDKTAQIFVIVIGWGIEDKVPYWICQGVYGVQFGEEV